MSDLLSAQLLDEINNENTNENEIPPNIEDDEPLITGDIEVEFMLIPGLRTGSTLIWVPSELNLYYKNSVSKKTGVEACKCYKPRCNVRFYIREDGTAFKKTNISHSSHSSMYKDYKLMYCFNKMKKRANTALASTSTYQIYMEAVIE